MKDVDPAARTLRLLGKGTDSTGSSGASMNLTARIEAAEGGLVHSGGRERSVDERQGGCLRRTHDEHGRRPDPEAVRRQLRGSGQRAPGATSGSGGSGQRRAGSCRADPSTGCRRTERPRARVDDFQGLAARPVFQENGVNPPAQRMNEVVDLQLQLEGAGYVAEPALAAALLLMLDLGRPLLLEGDAGVGKTEVAKALATVRGARLIRLQCYEGLDVHAAMYEWNYQRQLLAIKLLEHDERPAAVKEQDIFSERYLLEAPAARGDQLRRAAGAADRRGRPRRRGLRSLPARTAVGLPDVDPGTRHRARRYATAGRHHLERHARALRRAAPPLPVPVHRLSRLREGAGDRRDQGAAGGGTTCPPGGRVRAERAPHGPAEEAGHRGDARLDGGPAAHGNFA